MGLSLDSEDSSGFALGSLATYPPPEEEEDEEEEEESEGREEEEKEDAELEWEVAAKLCPIDRQSERQDEGNEGRGWYG